MEGSDVFVWPGGLVGFRVVPGKEGAKPSHIPGVAMAMRQNGDQVLFAQSEDESREPAAWIAIGEFVVHPAQLATEDDLFEDEPIAEGVEVEPEDRHPMDAKRPRVNLNVLRREK